MRSNLRIVSILVVPASAVALALALTSCDKNPTSPAPTPAAGGNVPATPTVVRIMIAGADSVEPGGSAQLSATAIKSDGSSEDVTNRTTWSSTNGGVLTVNSEGLLNGRARGEALVFGRYQTRSASLTVLVLPKDTFRLTGQVTDSGVGLPGVTVMVIGGIGEGMTVTTDGSGNYAFYGVAGTVRLHAKKDGYLNQIQEIQVAAHRSAEIQMSFAGERRSLAGTYSLTITTKGQCYGTAFPPDARTRSYRATIDQNGARLSVTLSGADFIVTNGVGNHFDGDLFGDRVVLRFGYEYYYYYVSENAVIERFPPTALVISGIVDATATDSRISGRMAGVIGISRNSVAPFYSLTSFCYGADHQFEMVR
jgi:hypothetical protein